jgi:hypothetical protein
MVNFTSLSLSHEPAVKYPPLISRATLWTLQGMAQAARLGASLNLDVLQYRRKNMFYNATDGYSYNLIRNATSAQIVETILADGGKACMTPYNVFLSRISGSVGDQVEYCASHNKTVAEHYRFGNNKQFGWISVIWTTGIGMKGLRKGCRHWAPPVVSFLREGRGSMIIIRWFSETGRWSMRMYKKSYEPFV